MGQIRQLQAVQPHLLHILRRYPMGDLESLITAFEQFLKPLMFDHTVLMSDQDPHFSRFIFYLIFTSWVEIGSHPYSSQI